jgi:hypothetical protein
VPPRTYRLPIVFAILIAIATVVVIGRSSLIQHWIAQSDGFVVVVDEPQRELSVGAGATVPLDFRLTSVTSQPVEVLGIKTGCGCTSAEPVPCTIAGHSTQTVRLTISMRGQSEGAAFELSPELYLDRPARKVEMLIRLSVIE